MMFNQFVTDVLSSADAAQIVTLCQHVYRDSYYLEWMYDEKYIDDGIRSGKLIFIGVKHGNKLVAKTLISYPSPQKTLAELSTLVVLPSYSLVNNGEVIRMLVAGTRERLNSIAREQPLAAIFSKTVTTHLVAQKLQPLMGLVPIGLSYCTKPIYSNSLDLKHDVTLLNVPRYDHVISMLCYSRKVEKIIICVTDKIFFIIKKMLDTGPYKVCNTDALVVPSRKNVDTNYESKRSIMNVYFSCGISGEAPLENILDKVRAKDIMVTHVYINVGEYNNIEYIDYLQKKRFRVHNFATLLLWHKWSCAGNAAFERVSKRMPK